VREKLSIRGTSSSFGPYLEAYPRFQKKWLSRDDGFMVVIEGYLDDAEYKEFYEYLRQRVGYGVAFIDRKYNTRELSDSRLLSLWITATFEPTGEEAGTKYVYPCPICEAGRRVVGDLVLNLSMIPKGKDIAKTIAMDEWVVSQRLADLMGAEAVTGVDLRPVKHYSKRSPTQAWYQMVITPTVTISRETTYGTPFKPHEQYDDVKTACGHAVKSILYSELYVREDSYDGSDIVKTNLYFGGRLNLVNYYPHILISQRFYRLLKDHNVKGYQIEVARLV
jgi:hypothetical protein